MPDDRDVDHILEAAIASHEACALDRAEALYRDVLHADPGNADALNLLGLVLQDTDRTIESIVLIEQAIEIEPNFPEALANLARGFNFLGRPADAIAAGEKSVALSPDLAEAWQQLGLSYIALNRDRDAVIALKKAITGFPENTELHAALGAIAQRLEDYTGAARAWRTVLKLQPDRIEALVNLGAALACMDQTDEALRLHRRAFELAPDDAVASGALAVTLSRRFECNELVTLCQAILARQPGNVDMLLLMGGGLTFLGRFEEARSAYREALALRPDSDAARWQLAGLATGVASEEEIEEFRTRFNDTTVSLTDRIAMGYAVGHSLDRAGDHDSAFRAYLAVNALVLADLKAKNTGFDLRKLQTYIDWACGVFDKTVFEELRPWGNPSELPVFIVGMPRSGTSLVEQIAASHPRVHGAGERRDIIDLVARINRGRKDVPPRQWDQTGLRQETERHLAMLRTLGGEADRVIDKLPDNIQLLGQIFVMFPNARVVVCQRDLRDVCVSCFTTHFGDDLDWTYDLEECARRALEIERLMEHWRTVLPGRVLEISYEDVVANLEAESRRLIAFLGLDWDPACLEFHKNKRQVTTASVQQVRRPIYDRSMGRWRRYEAHLGPMLAILDRHVSGSPAAQATIEDREGEAIRRGLTLLAAGELEAAIQVLRAATLGFPDSHDAFSNLGLALNGARDFAAAVVAWRRALAIRPDHALTHANLGYALNQAGEHEEALRQQREAVALAPDEPDFQRMLASALWQVGDVTGARDAYADAHTMAPGHVASMVSLGHCEAILGNFEAASVAYQRALAVNPDVAEAHAALISIGRDQTKGDRALLKTILYDDTRSGDDRVWAGFGLGQAQDGAREYDAAFASFQTANEFVRNLNERAGRSFNGAALEEYIQGLISMFPKSIFQRTHGKGDPSELPVFIVGVPRAGTTLVEQILASHGQIFSVGERSDFVRVIERLSEGNIWSSPAAWDPAALRAQAATVVDRLRAFGGSAHRVTVKTAANLQWLGHIAVLFPGARIILCRRDPRDVGLSCYTTNFKGGLPWTNDLADIATYLCLVERLITHWRMVLPGQLLEVQYEDLVTRPEPQIRRLIDFVGLDWDPACLAHHRTSRIITSPAMWQVRQPVYTDSVGQWRNYRQHLGPLLDGLDGLIPV